MSKRPGAASRRAASSGRRGRRRVRAGLGFRLWHGAPSAWKRHRRTAAHLTTRGSVRATRWWCRRTPSWPRPRGSSWPGPCRALPTSSAQTLLITPDTLEAAVTAPDTRCHRRSPVRADGRYGCICRTAERARHRGCRGRRPGSRGNLAGPARRLHRTGRLLQLLPGEEPGSLRGRRRGGDVRRTTGGRQDAMPARPRPCERLLVPPRHGRHNSRLDAMQAAC